LENPVHDSQNSQMLAQRRYCEQTQRLPLSIWDYLWNCAHKKLHSCRLISQKTRHKDSQLNITKWI